MALESEMGNSRQNSEPRYPELNKNYSIFVGPQPQRQPQWSPPPGLHVLM